MRAILLVGLVITLAPASAQAKRDTTRVDTAWMVTAHGAQTFSWTADAVAGPPLCGPDEPYAATRTVAGNGAFSLRFTTPRAYRMATVQVLKRAAKTHPERTLSYRPKGAPKIEDHVQFPADVSVSGMFTDDVLACDPQDTKTTAAPADGCGGRQATLELRFSFGVIGARTLNNADLQGMLVRPWFLDANQKSACPTYRSVAQSYFDGKAACPDVTALDVERPSGRDGWPVALRSGERAVHRLVPRSA